MGCLFQCNLILHSTKLNKPRLSPSRRWSDHHSSKASRSEYKHLHNATVLCHSHHRLDNCAQSAAQKRATSFCLSRFSPLSSLPTLCCPHPKAGGPQLASETGAHPNSFSRSRTVSPSIKPTLQFIPSQNET